MGLSLQQPAAAFGAPDFTITLLPRHSRLPALVISLMLHILLVVCSPALGEFLRLLDEYSSNQSVYAVQMIPMRRSQPLYYYPEPQPKAPAGRATPLKAQPAVARPSRPRIALSRQIELPPLPEPPRIRSVVVQPVPPNAAALLAPLPAITAWVPARKPAPKPFVAPGRSQPAAPQPVLDSPPDAAKPNLEARLSDLNIAGSPVFNAPALPRPPSSTAPVRVFQLPERRNESRNAGLGRIDGDPANLIVIGPGGQPAGPYVSIPAVVQGAAVGAASAIAPPPGPEAAKSGTVANPGSAPGPGAPGNPGGGRQTQGFDLLASSRTVDPPLPATRIARPKEGSYSFVVTGAAVTESFPETAGMLSGKLVYSVYLRTGARPDWILLYCLPKNAPQTPPGGRSPAKLEAPYAFLMLRPQLAFGPEDERFFVHGMLNEAGKFEQLEMAGEAGAAAKIKEPFLNTLRLWEFRPASRDGKPTPVEILLIIPRQEP